LYLFVFISTDNYFGQREISLRIDKYYDRKKYARRKYSSLLVRSVGDKEEKVLQHRIQFSNKTSCSGITTSNASRSLELFGPEKMVSSPFW
jgi:hypothetical protein